MQLAPAARPTKLQTAAPHPLVLAAVALTGRVRCRPPPPRPTYWNPHPRQLMPTHLTIRPPSFSLYMGAPDEQYPMYTCLSRTAYHGAGEQA